MDLVALAGGLPTAQWDQCTAFLAITVTCTALLVVILDLVDLVEALRQTAR